MKLLSVAGARPNFMKIAALARAVDRFNANGAPGGDFIAHVIVHTGQHYEDRMSQAFFVELEIPAPDINLGVGSGSQAVQTARIMERFEPVLMKHRPDVLLVVGDVNSTIACSLVAAKIEYPNGSRLRRPLIGHVEAGLRSFDRDMPEEINRILTDSISDLFFVTEESGFKNLLKEGVSPSRIHHVGNVMIDTLCHHLEKAGRSSVLENLRVSAPYALATLHRPSNVDSPAPLQSLLDCFREISERIPIIFPMHPRTRARINEFGMEAFLARASRIRVVEPLGYLDFLKLASNAAIVITDSGGIQEETTYLGIPCVTLRKNTERPVTVEIGSNFLCGTEPERILEVVFRLLSGGRRKSGVPELWDGKAGDRIIAACRNCYSMAIGRKMYCN